MALSEAKPDPRPETEGGIGRPKARARSRARTHRLSWAQLHAAKGGPCRLCGGTPYQLHHLLSKARGGPNEAWNLVPLCSRCHEAVTREHAGMLVLLAKRLEDAEYAGLIAAGGEGIFERLFGVRYAG